MLSSTLRKGTFITFEGVEGAGKSTQIKRIAQILNERGYAVIITREPGGTKGAETIRDLLVHGDVDQWSPLTECLLMNAARADHVEKVIAPALEEGKIVLCDRFMDSTRAYQGEAGLIDMEMIIAIEERVVGAARPDLTFIFDLPVEAGLERASVRGGADRFEKKGVSYHEKVRQAFLRIAKQEPQRCKVVDAMLSIDDLTDAVLLPIAYILDDTSVKTGVL